MVALQFNIVLTVTHAVGIITVAVGAWRHLIGSRFEAELHRQLDTGGSAAGMTSLLVIRLRTVVGHVHR